MSFLQSPTVSVVTVYALNYVCVSVCVCVCVCVHARVRTCMCVCPCVCPCVLYAYLVYYTCTSTKCVYIALCGFELQACIMSVQHACCVEIYHSNTKVTGVITVCHAQL